MKRIDRIEQDSHAVDNHCSIDFSETPSLTSKTGSSKILFGLQQSKIWNSKVLNFKISQSLTTGVCVQVSGSDGGVCVWRAAQLPADGQGSVESVQRKCLHTWEQRQVRTLEREPDCERFICNKRAEGLTGKRTDVKLILTHCDMSYIRCFI